MESRSTPVAASATRSPGASTGETNATRSLSASANRASNASSSVAMNDDTAAASSKPQLPTSEHPAGPSAARRPSIATRVETFLRQESQQRGTSWMVVATVLAIFLAALVIYGAGFR